jgi:hypothetical protein
VEEMREGACPLLRFTSARSLRIPMGWEVVNYLVSNESVEPPRRRWRTKIGFDTIFATFGAVRPSGITVPDPHRLLILFLFSCNLPRKKP